MSSGADHLLGLPALKRLGELRGTRPTVVIDARENLPLRFTRLASVSGTLVTGDYAIRGAERFAAVEKKTISDLVGSISSGRGRFEREMMRIRAYPFRRLVILGSRAEIERHAYRSEMSPKAVLHTLAAFEIRYDCPVCWFGSAEACALQIESWFWWISRQIVEDANDLFRGSQEELLTKDTNISAEGN